MLFNLPWNAALQWGGNVGETPLAPATAEAVILSSLRRLCGAADPRTVLTPWRTRQVAGAIMADLLDARARRSPIPNLSQHRLPELQLEGPRSTQEQRMLGAREMGP